MKKLDFVQMSQLLANIGVVAGIVYLGVETNQNTKSLEVSAFQDVVSRIFEWSDSIVEDPRRMELALGDTSLAEMDAEDRLMTEQIILQLFALGDMIHFQYERGVISEERLGTGMAPLSLSVCAPNFEVVWNALGGIYSSDYQDYVNTIMQRCE